MADVAGLPLMNMPDGVTPLSALVVMKVLDEGGNVRYFAVATEGLMTVEALGMVRYADWLLLNGDGGDE